VSPVTVGGTTGVEKAEPWLRWREREQRQQHYYCFRYEIALWEFIIIPPPSSELLLEYLGLLFLFLLVPGSTVSPRSSRSR